MLIVGKNNFHEWRRLLKVLEGGLPEDDAAFQDWLAEDIENKKLYQILKSDFNEVNINFDKDKVFNNLSEILDFKLNKRIPLYRKKWFLYIASLLILISTGIAGYLVLPNINSPGKTSNAKYFKKNIQHNPEKTYLLSSQGETIDLSETFEVKKNDGTIISNTSESVTFKQSIPEKKKIEYYTINIPKGGEYKLLLSDGSKVYLNSETQLIFPNYFKEDVRQVELIGEAYFEIVNDNKPFVVKTADMQIRVLGTSFNVNAYKDNSSVNTTLVEGSIEVNVSDNPETFLIKPENNFSFNKLSKEISIEKVDMHIYTAWLKGELIFRNQSLDDIFSRLARWHDFTITYEDPAIKLMRFTGSALKDKPLDYVLNQIQSVTDLKYRSEGDKIILYKP